MNIVMNLPFIFQEHLIEYLRLKGFDCALYLRGVVDNTGKGIFKKLNSKNYKYLPELPHSYKSSIGEITIHDDCILYSKDIKLPKTIYNSKLSPVDLNMMTTGHPYMDCSGAFNANYSIPNKMGMFTFDITLGWRVYGAIPLNDPILINLINTHYKDNNSQAYIPHVVDMPDEEILKRFGRIPQENEFIY